MLMRISDVLAKLPAAMKATAVVQRDFRDKRAKARTQHAARWAAANPERYAAIRSRVVRKRSARILAAKLEAGPVVCRAVDALRAAWRDESAWSCHYCGKDAPRVQRTADHVRPLSKGGKHVPANLVRACRRCNSRKNAREVWFA